MRYVVSLVLAFALFGSGCVSFGQIEKESSEITGVERLKSKDMRSLHSKQYAGSNASFRAEYVNDPDDGTSWIITVYGFTEEPTIVSESTDFLVNVNGKQLEPTRLESKTREVNGSLIEVKNAFFTRSAFEEIAKARKEVTISIGSAQFVAIHPGRKDMRLILDRVPAEQLPQTAGNSDPDSRR